MAKLKFVAAWLITREYRAEIVHQLRLLAKTIEDAPYEEVVLFEDLEPTERAKHNGITVHMFHISNLYVKPAPGDN